MNLIEAKHISKQFVVQRDWLGRPKKTLTAVDDLSLTIGQGETVGLVGESGCGKSTFARTLLGLYAKTGGSITYKGRDIADRAVGRDYRRHVQMIFQDPYASLDPRMTVEDIISEPLRNYHLCQDDSQRRQRVASLLEQVDMRPEAAQRYPHEFSGGQRQRIGIARAIVLEPQIVVCDEPVSALDVSVQAKVINLLEELQEKLGLSYIFISHDLSVVKHISDTVMVMYLGHTMELASKDELFAEPLHPYTKALLDVIPRIRHERIQDKKILEGDVPSPTNPPAGCVFHTRCAHCMKVCCEREPEMREVKPGHKCACHLFDEGLTDEEKAPVAI